MYKIQNRTKYERRKAKKRSISEVASGILMPAHELRKYSKRQCYGLDPQRDLCSEYPPGETRESQERKQKLLVDMSKSGEVIWKDVLKLMKDTYASQRATINSLTHMEDILDAWPFFGKVSLSLTL